VRLAFFEGDPRKRERGTKGGGASNPVLNRKKSRKRAVRQQTSTREKEKEKILKVGLGCPLHEIGIYIEESFR